MNGHSMNPLRHAPLPRRAVEARLSRHGGSAEQNSEALRLRYLAMADRPVRDRVEHARATQERSAEVEGAITGQDRDRLLSRYSRKGSKRLYHRVRLGLRGRGRFLLHAFGIVLCVVSWLTFAILSGCGLAGPVGVPGPVGATHGDV